VSESAYARTQVHVQFALPEHSYGTVCCALGIPNPSALVVKYPGLVEGTSYVGCGPFGSQVLVIGALLVGGRQLVVIYMVANGVVAALFRLVRNVVPISLGSRLVVLVRSVVHLWFEFGDRESLTSMDSTPCSVAIWIVAVVLAIAESRTGVPGSVVSGAAVSAIR